MSRIVTITAAIQIELAVDVTLDELGRDLPHLLRNGLGAMIPDQPNATELLAIHDRLGLLNKPFDIHRVLDERNEVAIVWDLDDVEATRPDLNAEQAIQLLVHARDAHDPAIGINWRSLEASAETLFGPEPDLVEVA
jgi:hypothetical protein